MSSTLIPLNDRILIAAPPRKKDEEIIKDGIIIPKVASNATRADLDPTHMIVDVIDVGHKCEVVKKGQRVVVRKPSCFVVKMDSEETEHVMVREADVVAIVG